MRFLRSGFAQRRKAVIFLTILGCSLLPYTFAQDQTAQPSHEQPFFDPISPDEAAKQQTPVTSDHAKPADSRPADIAPADKPDEPATSAIKLGPGDLVEVGVYGVPELTTKARVSNDGDLYLPLIDYVHVGDLSLEESQKLDDFADQVRPCLRFLKEALAGEF
jgi:hypothetical protein